MNTENLKPLTLEQLREMDGKPVWLHTFSRKTKKTNISEWALVASSGEYSVSFVRVAVCGRFEKRCEDYGKTWAAYACPPVRIDKSKCVAQWIPMTDDDGCVWFECSACEYDLDSMYGPHPFCPECGRAMTDEAWAELERRLTE